MTLPSSPLRALVIDDDEMSRELLTVLLEAEGYAVDSADSGQAALTRLIHSDRAYDVILTDQHMPGIARAELASKLRHVCGPHPLLLAISGSQSPATDIALYDDFLLKPFPMRAVAHALLNRASRTEKIVDAAATLSPSKSPIHSATSPQSRTVQVSQNIFSIAASAAQDASNPSMSVPTQHHEFNDQIPQRAESTAGNGMANMPVLNELIYRQLVGSMPTPQLKEMYTLCVNDARKRIAGMRQLITQHDNAQFVREAHAIKGGCGMLGATELHRRAAALETSGLSDEQQGGPRDVNSLDELCAACDRLERILGSRV